MEEVEEVEGNNVEGKWLSTTCNNGKANKQQTNKDKNATIGIYV